MRINSVSRRGAFTRRGFLAVPGAAALGLLAAKQASACSVEAVCIDHTDTSITIRVIFGAVALCSPVPERITVTDVTGSGTPVGPFTFPADPDGSTDITIHGLTCNVSYTFELVGYSMVGDIELRSEAVRVTCAPECPPAGGCTLTLGYWKNHPEDWVGVSLSLGTHVYTQAQLLTIFNTEVSGNGLISLAHQLIAAKLNVLAGASSAEADTAIAAADALIGTLVVGTGYLHPSVTSSLGDTLDAFNNGNLGPLHCAN